VRIELEDGTPAEVARPEAGEAAGGLVLCPDIMGLRPLFDDLVERLAREQGWVVVAPEPFPGREDLPLADRMAGMASLDDDTFLGHLRLAADATGQDRCGVLGFCMGGMLALKGSSTGRFDRAVSFYGMIRMPEGWASDTMRDAIDYVTAPGACPVLELAGDADSFVPVADLEELEATSATVVVYPGADHGFVHDASRPTHRADDAADAWSRAIDFLTT
jgi:carboxymethylenebutenolidase